MTRGRGKVRKRKRPERVRVLVADDHAILRSGLKLLIDSQPDMAVVGEAADGAQLVARVHADPPDVVVYDLGMPGAGLPLIERLAREWPDVKVLVLTMHDDPAYMRGAWAAGAVGYVVKRAADEELLAAIRNLRRVVPRAGPTHPGASRTTSGVSNALEMRRTVLSPREQQVLELLARGHTSREIAERIGVGVKTAETYRLRLGEKLGLRTRADVVQYALETGLLDPFTPPQAQAGLTAESRRVSVSLIHTKRSPA